MSRDNNCRPILGLSASSAAGDTVTASGCGASIESSPGSPSVRSRASIVSAAGSESRRRFRSRGSTQSDDIGPSEARRSFRTRTPINRTRTPSLQVDDIDSDVLGVTNSHDLVLSSLRRGSHGTNEKFTNNTPHPSKL